jgi:rRNA-processing protein FCF1
LGKSEPIILSTSIEELQRLTATGSQKIRKQAQAAFEYAQKCRITKVIKELSEIVVDLKPSLRLLQSVSQQLFEVLPDVSSELTNVNDAISETLYSTRITADPAIIPVNTKTAGGEEILNEVSGFLEQKLAETLLKQLSERIKLASLSIITHEVFSRLSKSRKHVFVH